MEEGMPDELIAEANENEFEIESKGKKFKFKYKTLGWYKEETLYNKCLNIDPVTKKVTIDIPRLELKYMMESLTDAPFKITPENLLKLDSAVKKEIVNRISGKRLTKELEKK